MILHLLFLFSLPGQAAQQIALIGCDPGSEENRIIGGKDRLKQSRNVRISASKSHVVRCATKDLPAPRIPGVKLGEATPKISAIQNFAPLLGSTSPLRVTAVFGVLEPKGRRQLDLKVVAERLKTLSLPWSDAGERLFRSDINPSNPASVYEPGAMELLSFFRHVGRVAEISRVEVLALEGASIRFSLNGKFRGSGRETRLEIYYGPTPGHEEIFRSGLESSEIVFYSGHSGEGKNLSLSRVGTSKPKPGYQLIALFNCLGYTYFGEDLLEARRGLATDLILSTSSDGGNYYLIQLLSHLDRNLMGEAGDLEQAFNRRKEFLVLKRQLP